MRRIVAAAALALVLTMLLAAPSSATAQEGELDCARTIVGCAAAGPKPENPGDRGGYAQMLTLGVLIAGVGFIGFRVVSAVRAGDARTSQE